MPKATRLLDILTILGARRFPVTAEVLADELGVTPRTIYRDIEDLRRTGADILGEAGLGYVLGAKAHIPPLNFTEDEIYAILTGIEMVGAFTDDEFAISADHAREKIMAGLDHRRKQQAERLPYRAPKGFSDPDQRTRHRELRELITDKIKCELNYVSIKGEKSTRIIWPLGLAAWFGAWTLTAWCERREDYRTFRVDLIRSITPLNEKFTTSSTRSFAHFLSNVTYPKS